jgi:putative ABC transport system substrate-binding protein
VPIVFAMVIDPVGTAFVESLARPGGNITGFMQFEYSLAGKWLELLKQIFSALPPRISQNADQRLVGQTRPCET